VQSPNDKIGSINFVGSFDPTIWLENKNDEHSPLLVPLWPEDYPKHLAVYFCESGKLGVALSREAMLKACHSLLSEEPTLWFCNIPLDELLSATTADPTLFL